MSGAQSRALHCYDLAWHSRVAQRRRSCNPSCDLRVALHCIAKSLEPGKITLHCARATRTGMHFGPWTLTPDTITLCPAPSSTHRHVGDGPVAGRADVRAALLHNARASHVRQLRPGQRRSAGYDESQGFDDSQEACSAGGALPKQQIIISRLQAVAEGDSRHNKHQLQQIKVAERLYSSGFRGGQPCRRSRAGQKRLASPLSAAH